MTLQLQGQGGQDDVRSFVDILARCTGKKISVSNGVVTRSNGAADPATQPLLDELDKLIKDDKTLVIKVRKKARRNDPVVDGFCLRLVVVEHLLAFPESPPADNPSAATRCEALIHILAEYGAALRDNYTACTEGFAPYHKKGIDAQTALRKTRGQCAAKQNVEVKGKLEMQHCNGTKTIVTQDPQTGGITVGHGPKEAKVEAPKIQMPKSPQQEDNFKSLFELSPYIFTGTIEEVGGRPRYWSNFFLSYQRVRYSAVEFIRGYLPGADLNVDHLVLDQTATAAHGAPGLRRSLFAPGKRMLVFAEPAIDPECLPSFRMVANHPNRPLSIALRDATARPVSRRKARRS